jgi:RecA/RadA recombinase
LAGPSKHFKTNLALVMGRAFQKKYKDGVILFYDSEFGSPQAYFEANGIDPSRVVHTPITDIEQLKFDLMQQIDGLERKDKVMIIVDSVGNLASKKEVEDALDGKSVADMTRAKQLKSLFRMVTPHLTLKQIPMIAVNHIYMTQEMYSKPVVSGGCLPEGEMILMADGSTKAVQEIQVGELVATRDGAQPVTDVWNPETLEFGEAECYEIEFEDGTTVRCSNQHPFLVEGTWVDAEDLVEGDEVTTLN